MLPPRFAVLDVGVDAVQFRQTVDLIVDWAVQGRREYLSLCNAFTVTAAHDLPDLAEVVNKSGLSVPDGMPLVWLGKFAGRHVERVYGPDLLLAVCGRGESLGLRHYFYGGAPGVNERLIARLLERFPALQIAGSYSPPFRELADEEERRIADDINDARADIVWVGLGTPKQDFWIARNRARITASIMIPVGAAFDFHSGSKPQAPRWMQRTGLEWLFRLMTEPRRLWRRYLIYNPRFVWLVLLQQLGLGHFGPPPRASTGPAGPATLASANVCGVRVDAIRLRDLLERVDCTARDGGHVAVYHANAHLINLAQRDADLRAALAAADHVFCDGEGVRFASRMLGQPLPERFTPPDWINQLGDLCAMRGYGLFLLGSHDGVADAAAAALRRDHPGLKVTAHHGYFDHFGADVDPVIDAINASGAKVLLVGMGMPLQEKWIHSYLPRLNVNVAMSVGALFDYLAGRVARGPRVITDHGLEWLWRLVVEPRRLWRRYLIGNPAFLYRVVRQKLAAAA